MKLQAEWSFTGSLHHRSRERHETLQLPKNRSVHKSRLRRRTCRAQVAATHRHPSTVRLAEVLIPESSSWRTTYEYAITGGALPAVNPIWSAASSHRAPGAGPGSRGALRAAFFAPWAPARGALASARTRRAGAALCLPAIRDELPRLLAKSVRCPAHELKEYR